MDWMNLIPAAIQYIEDHLIDDTPDSFTKAFSIIGMPRVFSYDVTGCEIN